MTIVVTGTQISPFSASDTYNVLHGGYLYDPMATPLSFFYPISVFGGEISTIFGDFISGGDFKISYDDLPENELILEGHYVFCNSEVIFDFSKFDKTESKIIKLVFDPNNNYEKQTFNYYVSSGQNFYPNLNSVKSEYYPSEEFYTLYSPKFTIHYEDGNFVNIVIPLTSIQCGIFDSYKDKTLVESVPFYKSESNVLLFINDTQEDDIILTNISTSLVFELEELTTAIPFVEETPLAALNAAILEQLLTTTIKIPEPPVKENPVNPPVIVKGKGIVTIKDGIQITEINGDDLYPIDGGGIVTFLQEQIYSFNNEDIYPFETSIIPPTQNGIVRFVSNDPLIRFGSGDNIVKFS